MECITLTEAEGGIAAVFVESAMSQQDCYAVMTVSGPWQEADVKQKLYSAAWTPVASSYYSVTSVT